MEKRMIFCTACMMAVLFVGAGACAMPGSSPIAADDNFRTLVGAGDFNATGVAINAFLETVEPELGDAAKMTELKNWLEAKDCISKVEVLCVSCIYTYPPQSELIVTFDVNGKKTVLTLDISMGDPPRFSGYHEAYLDFCTFVGAGDFNATGAAVNAFLETVEPELDDAAKMTALKNWLEAKDCISKVEALCVSCIETYPPQSELIVTFDVNGEKTVLAMDISMGDPPRFSGYHEANAGYAAPVGEAVQAYFSGGILHVNSPVAETVIVYSTDGTLLRQMQKPSGTATFDLSRLPGGMLIAKGGSGWTKKIVISD